MGKNIHKDSLTLKLLLLLAEKKEATVSGLSGAYYKLKDKKKNIRKQTEEYIGRQKERKILSDIGQAIHQLHKKGLIEREKRKLIQRIKEDNSLIKEFSTRNPKRNVFVYKITQAGLKKLKQLKIKIIVPS